MSIHDHGLNAVILSSQSSSFMSSQHKIMHSRSTRASSSPTAWQIQHVSSVQISSQSGEKADRVGGNSVQSPIVSSRANTYWWRTAPNLSKVWNLVDCIWWSSDNLMLSAPDHISNLCRELEQSTNHWRMILCAASDAWVGDTSDDLRHQVSSQIKTMVWRYFHSLNHSCHWHKSGWRANSRISGSPAGN